MYYYGTVSAARISTCDPRLQALFRRVLEGYDHSVACGHRNETDQMLAYNSGNSKVRWPDGKHNTDPSRAVDVAPYPIDWNDLPRFYHFAGYVLATAEEMGIHVRWGGDWDSDKDFKDQRFNDLVHWELVE